MKKTAMTTLEVLIAMSLMVAVTILSVNTLKTYINKDTDIAKFKQAFSTLSQVIYSLRTDTAMYPQKGFEYTNPTYYFNEEERVYSGEDKFKKLFMSKFNVFETKEITFSSNVPLLKFENRDGDVFYKVSNKINCFVENKGFMFCPPTTVFEETFEYSYIYIPLYVNKIDFSDSTTTDIKKAIFTEVKTTGEIEVPPIIYNAPVAIGGQSNKLIDCTNKEFNDYNHCKVLDKMLDTDF